MTGVILEAIAAACAFVVGFVLGDLVRNWLRCGRAEVPKLYEQIADLNWQLERERVKRRTAEAIIKVTLSKHDPAKERAR